MQTADQPMTFGLVVRRGLALALLGFLIITLAGPAAVVAGFAILGYVGYRGFRFLWFGEKPPEWGRMMQIGKTVFSGIFSVVRRPVGWLWSGARAVGGLVGSTVGTTWSLGTEAISGTILGAALGVMIGWPLELDQYLVALGAGAGSLVGLWVGIDNLRRERKLAARHAALEASLS